MYADNFDDILDFFIQNYSFDEIQTLKAASTKKKTDPAADTSTEDDNFDEFTPVN